MSTIDVDWQGAVPRLAPSTEKGPELAGVVGAAVGGAALSPVGAALLVAGEVGRYLGTREQRLRLKLELESRRSTLELRLRELEVTRAANRTFLEAQCRDRADAREALVALAKDLIGVAEAVISAAGATSESDAGELCTLARECIAAAVSVIREKFPAGALAVVHAG